MVHLDGEFYKVSEVHHALQEAPEEGKAKAILRQMIVAFDANQDMEFLEACHLARLLCGLRIDREDVEVLEVNQMRTTLEEPK